jgi:hypothetical protein
MRHIEKPISRDPVCHVSFGIPDKRVSVKAALNRRDVLAR